MSSSLFAISRFCDRSSRKSRRINAHARLSWFFGIIMHGLGERFFASPIYKKHSKCKSNGISFDIVAHLLFSVHQIISPWMNIKHSKWFNFNSSYAFLSLSPFLLLPTVFWFFVCTIAAPLAIRTNRGKNAWEKCIHKMCLCILRCCTATVFNRSGILLVILFVTESVLFIIFYAHS